MKHKEIQHHFKKTCSLMSDNHYTKLLVAQHSSTVDQRSMTHFTTCIQITKILHNN